MHTTSANIHAVSEKTSPLISCTTLRNINRLE